MQRIVGTRPGLESRSVIEGAAGSGDLCRAGSVEPSGFELHGEPFDPGADREALTKLALWCQIFSPLVGLEESDRPESLLLDLTGLAPLFGGERALVERLGRAFAERGYRLRAAVADTVGAAWALAHFAGRTGPYRLVPLSSPNASAACCAGASLPGPAAPGSAAPGSSPRRTGEAAFVLVPPGESFDALMPLPVAALRLPDAMTVVLGRLGIERIGPLMRLPRSELASRFDPCLLKRLDQAMAAAAETIAAVRPGAARAVAWEWEFPVDHGGEIERRLGGLIDRLCVLLLDRAEGALELVCRLQCGTAAAVEFRVGLFQPSASPEHLFELVRMQLERVRLAAPVTGVHLQVTASDSLVQRQQKLFADDLCGPDSHRLASLVDRLASRLGRAAVLGVERAAGVLPERAFRYVRLVGLRRRRRAGSRSRSSPLKPLQRPLYILPRPEPVAVVAIAPDGPPVRFRRQGRSHRVARHWGPERIETAWWRGRPVRRDYYRVETTAGNRFWLFRDLDDGQWLLHGMFG